MTSEELNRIAESIKRTKEPNETVTLRDILNAFGRSLRTQPAIDIVRNWLSENTLNTAVEVSTTTDLDTPLRINFKYPIKHDYFQLYSLWISDYRNLNDFNIDFENTNQYCTLIGLNGSGKSNVIEAISEIFRHLYKKTECPFGYVLRYIMDGEYYEIRDGRINGAQVDENQLPRNIVASYSGEDNRMWKTHFWPLYQEYCQDITNMPNIAVPKMLAVGRKQWNIAFLTLLYAQKSNNAVEDFLKSIIQTANCQIRLEFNEDSLKVWKETTGKHFVNALKSKNVYSVEEFSSVIDDLIYVDSPSTLFNLLYQATSERGNSPISDVDIVIEGHGSLNGLSEGEKKMIVVITIMEILSTERSLCLFDEPDSHVHVSRKMEMLNLIDTNNRYSILTTHSPMFIDEEKEGNIRYMNNGKVENVDRLRRVKQLSGNTISLIDAAYIIGWKKKILFVEGQYDKKYLEKAIDVLSVTNPDFLRLKRHITILSIGGTGDTEAKYDELIRDIIDELDKVVFLFDYDGGGLAGWNKINNIVTASPLLAPKIVPLFYQQQYGTPFDGSYPSNVNSINGINSFMVEDLFNENDYRSEITQVTSSTTHKEFRCIKKSTAEKIKEYIEKHYSSFTDYSRFEPILQKLMDIFDLT